MGIKYEEVYDPQDVAHFNFHGQYYTDSDKLEEHLHFRQIPGNVYWGAVKAEMERMMANPMIAAMMPDTAAMRAHNKEIAAKRLSPGMI